MPDESATTPKSTAEELKEKSPQVVIATTIALLSELLENDTQAKVLKICSPAIALAVVLSVTKLTELGVFLFKYFTTKTPEEETRLDLRLKRYIKENERQLFWMRKSNPMYIELVQHTKALRKRLRKYQLGELTQLELNVPTAPTTPTSALPPSAP